MNFALLLPAGLLALVALLVPVLLHLARRSEHLTIEFSALRWLAARARPRRRLQLAEKGLLLLRLLLIAALAVLLAEPVWTGSMRHRPWTVVVPGARIAPAPESTGAGEGERRWLAPGYPPLESPAPTGAIDTASLLRELDARLPAETPLTVWTPRELSGLDGASIDMARRVRWRIAPGAMKVSASPGASPEPFAVRLEPGREPALGYLRAAWRAWAHAAPPVGAGRLEPVPLPDVSLSANAPRAGHGSLVWLRSGALPPEVGKWILAGGTILIEPRTSWRFDSGRAAVVWRDDAGHPLAHAQRSGRGRIVRLAAPLDESALPALLDGSFAPALREMLYPRDAAPALARARDVAPVFRNAVRRAGVPMTRDLGIEHWLAYLIAMVFVIERLVATAARRWRSA